MTLQRSVYRAVYTIYIYTLHIYKLTVNSLYLRLPAGKVKLSKTVTAVGNLLHVPVLLFGGGGVHRYVRAG